MSDIPMPKLNQLLVPEALWPRITAWLNTQGFEVLRLPPELFQSEELPTYVLTPADYLVDLMRSGRVTRAEEEAAARYAKTFDTIPSDETADYMKTRLDVRGLGCRDLGYEEPR